MKVHAQLRLEKKKVETNMLLLCLVIIVEMLALR